MGYIKLHKNEVCKFARYNSCDDTFTNDIITTHPNNPPSNRSAFDNYFDWDRINDIETINPFTHTITTMGIPWKKVAAII